MQNNLHQSNLTLLTDLYQLTMAHGYWQQKMEQHEAVFHLFFRKTPFKGNFSIAAGLENVVNYLQNFYFSYDDIRYLGGLKGADGQPLFAEGFLNYLQRLRFSCEVDAVPEGTIVFPHEPLIRIKGNLIQAQLVETALLTLVNFPTLVATKAARIVQAAAGDPVLEFGLRRAQGIDGGLTASRAAYIGGCVATSNVLASKLYHLPVRGTHAHSWVMCFESELEAFDRYAQAMPSNCVFLVDTYDTIKGVKNAIEIGKKLRKIGHDLIGIRLDSGDLATLSQQARQLLDAAGFEQTQIAASNDLDEYEIQDLKAKGAKIGVWGVGTRLVTAYDQPSLGGVYKLAAIRSDSSADWQYRLKRSEEMMKVSNPGILQVRRLWDSGRPTGDVIWDEASPTTVETWIDFETNQVRTLANTTFEDLLQPIFREGKLVYDLPPIAQIRQRTLSQLADFQLVMNERYPVGLEENLTNRKIALLQGLAV